MSSDKGSLAAATAPRNEVAVERMNALSEEVIVRIRHLDNSFVSLHINPKRARGYFYHHGLRNVSLDVEDSSQFAQHVSGAIISRGGLVCQPNPSCDSKLAIIDARGHKSKG